MAADGRRRGLSVRARTTLGAALVVGAALLASAFALTRVVRSSLVHDTDQLAEVLAFDIGARAEDRQLASTLVADEDEAVQVVDGQGRVLAATANLAGRTRIANVVPATGSIVTRTIDGIPGVLGESRLLAYRTTTSHGPVTVYVVMSLKSADSTIVLLRTSLLVGVPLLLGLVIGLTWLGAGRALRPVDAIRAQVAEITQQDLGRRVPVPNTNDEVHRLSVTMNEMLDRLQALVEQQRRFVADASHELQSPLAANRADLEVALAHPDATDLRTTLADVLDENRRMERLVGDLLFIARVEGDPAARVFAPVDLHEIVLDEAARVPADGVRVDTSNVEGAFVLGRRDDLARAVRNLLDNAVRHARSAVTVELNTGDGRVDLVVADDGAGIPAGQQERIFERFARLDDARPRTDGGTGLGLAIVKQIVEHHGGTIHVADGRDGARFVTTLPADDRPRGKPRPIDARARSTGR